ncbi:MAG TPA: hypothetical protein VHX38_02860 [Pseudonocardiaceae bacterium]|jgi:hypothetical protein|nr:hypothetical protein [Pseudonocardiaceae bacterium]
MGKRRFYLPRHLGRGWLVLLYVAVGLATATITAVLMSGGSR